MSIEEVKEEQFEEALRRGPILRALQVLHFAFAAGVVLFAAVVVGFFFMGDAPQQGQEDGMPLDMLSLVHAALAFGVWTIGPLLFNNRLLRGKLPTGETTYPVMQGQNLDDPAVRCLLVIYGASILRIAMFEAPALFGLVICLLGVMSGTIHGQPLYWLNAISAAVLIVFVAVTFPTREQMMDTFRMKVAGTREPRVRR